ncbi:hypothetical protein BV394_03740 [Brevirhabdus pacifica]|uniref:Glycosyl transferase family 25 domain-containing protein n=1 Tax=Brevirhabdus pacifica TaxID=1267768 RepID=A0A1U7DG19_9RHOB|nr:glycosyltransferase family 25 protein [Brevirhabdus pacifica]APX88950.1 hypothetical protein BV394_03740 [Brevirhabdus pacifica]OWU80175.1 hypothetical protein ATO5_04425 [Loktanella sp. 22II-4b]PJJ86497.1 glycosyl transferase family 25 [Brevirhabdus pacifica]
MSQAIPIHVINLARRPDRMERLAAHLQERGLEWQRQDAVDAASAPPEALDEVIAASGPLGALGNGDRACTASHFAAWQSFLDGPAGHAMFMEDDVFLAEDTAGLLADTGWIPEGADVIKLEKFGDGSSRLLLGGPVADLPGGRALYRLMSRHVGGGAYILSRRGAEAALGMRGRTRVPIDHMLFNANLSVFARRHAALLVVPAMATQRNWAYNSDIAALGKAARPKGWALRWRKLRRGWFEVNRLPRQLYWLAAGRGKLVDYRFAETPPEGGKG